MSTRHEVEGGIGEGQRGFVGIGDDDHATRMEEAGGPCDVRRPRFGGHGRRWEPGRLGEDLSPTGLDVERRRGGSQSLGQLPGVAPWGPLLGGAALEPREVPPGDVGVGTEGDEIVEGSAHPATMASIAAGSEERRNSSMRAVSSLSPIPAEARPRA